MSNSWRIEFDYSGTQPEVNDPSILEWFTIHLHLFIRGRWRIVRSAMPLENTTETLSSPTESEAKNTSIPVEIMEQGGDSPKLIFSIGLDPGTTTQVTVERKIDDSTEKVPPTYIKVHKTSTDLPAEIQIGTQGSVSIPRPVEKNKFKISAPAIPRWLTLGSVLFFSSLFVYLLSRLIGLEQFPIYFFTDEAVHTVLAEQLVNNGFRYEGVFLPTYFSMGSTFALNSLSVYLQVIPTILFGKSIFVTRLVSVLISMIGAAAVGLTLRDFFKSKYWWSGVLILSITPTWFLHSRTAFEYIELASFFALFIFFYLSYRLKSANHFYLAIICGALVFYTHGLGQILITITAILLLIVDFPYHWKHRRVVLIGIGLVILLLIPYFRYTLSQPSVMQDQLRTRGSYWFSNDLSLVNKLGLFAKEYFYGLSPTFWYLTENGRDLIRHQMKGYGNLFFASLPFLIYGLFLGIRRINQPAFRTVLIAFLASPVGAALVQISVLRVIWLIIPVTLFTTVGLSTLLEKIERPRLPYKTVAISLFLGLSLINIYILRDVLVNGPTWFTDYTLYGMQYGAKQLFDETIPDVLSSDPSARMVVSPTWANGTDNFLYFFLSKEDLLRVRLESIDAYLFERLPLDDNVIMVLTQPEFERAVASPKFKKVETIRTINYPDGSPGFHLIRLAYADNADEIFAAEKLARSQPVEAYVEIDGQMVRIVYSQIDMGLPEHVFDNDVHTLMRGLEANPFTIDLYFPEPRQISGLIGDFANMDFTLTAELFEDPDGSPIKYESTYRGLQGDPHVEMEFENSGTAFSRIRLQILNLNTGEPAHIHIRELKFLP